MFDNDWEDKFEAAQEHQAGCHRGGWYPDCPICASMSDEETVAIVCNGGCCEDNMVPVGLLRSNPEYNYTCLGCATGINLLITCKDCGVLLNEDEQFTRVVRRETKLMVMINHQSVCFECYLDNPGSTY